MTPELNEQRPQRATGDHLVIEQLASEVMIYDRQRQKAFCLNYKAAFVWDHCDGKTTVTELADILAKTASEPADQKVVWLALESLAAEGLLKPSTFQPLLPVGLTRRHLIQKLGLSAAMSLPLVTGLLVAAPKAHASSHRAPSSPPPPPPPPPHRGH